MADVLHRLGLRKGKEERRALRRKRKLLQNFNSLFDEAWYRKTYPDAAVSGMSVFDHYFAIGAMKRYAPRREFTDSSGKNVAIWFERELYRRNIITNFADLGPKADYDNSGFEAPHALGNPQGKRLAVYTANFNGYDLVHSLRPEWLEHADFFIFADREVADAPHWRFIFPDYSNIDSTRSARFYKTHPQNYFGAYEWSMWIDGNIKLFISPHLLVEPFEREGVDIATFRHPDRKCIYVESMECSFRAKEESDVMFAQMKSYHDAGYPENNGLIESNVMLRRHNRQPVIDLMNRWWWEIECWSKRDQLSFNYCLAGAEGVRMGYFSESSARESSHFFLTRHS